MAAHDMTAPRPVLREGAAYWSDSARVICRDCAGATALYTGRDLSGQEVARVTVEDVRSWPDDLPALGCECRRVVLTRVFGPDGWPMPAPQPDGQSARRQQAGQEVADGA